jgi:hypothetical protein
MKKQISIPQIRKEPFNPKKKFIKEGSFNYLFEELVYDLLVPYKHLRFKRLTYVLNKYQIPYQLQTKGDIKNIIVNLNNHSQNKKVVLCGHYDIVENSFGINDNTCSIALLLNMIIQLRKENSLKPISIVFFDQEESGLKGSKLFLNENIKLVLFAINLDTIGVGDTLAFSANNKTLSEFFMDLGLNELNEPISSDNLPFIHHQIPVISITGLFEQNLIRHKETNKYYFYDKYHNETMHGGVDDDRMNIINFNLMNRLINLLLQIIK